MPSYQFEGHSVAEAPKKSGYSKNENHSHSANYSKCYQNSKGFGQLNNQGVDKENSQANTGKGNTRINRDKVSEGKHKCSSPLTEYQRLERDDPLLNGLLVHLDYMRVVVSKINGKQKLTETIDRLVNENPWLIREDRQWSPGGKGKIYQHTIRTVSGINGGIKQINDEDSENPEYEVMIDFAGSYIGNLRLIDQQRLCRIVKWELRGHATRLDIAINDFSGQKLIPREQMRQASKKDEPDEDGVRKDDRGNFRAYRYYYSEDKQGNPLETDYYGSFNSGKVCYVYDHWYQQLGEHIPRFEARFTRGCQTQIFDLLADWNWEHEFRVHETVEKYELQMAKQLAGYAVGVVDFRDMRTKKWGKNGKRPNKKDCKILPFWSHFTDNVIGENIQIKHPKPETSLHAKREWIKRQVAKTIEIFNSGLGAMQGREFWDEVKQEAKDRWKPEDDLWVEQLKREVQKRYIAPAMESEKLKWKRQRDLLPSASTPSSKQEIDEYKTVKEKMPSVYGFAT